MEGFKILHTRTHDNEEFFTCVTDISIPPSEFVKHFARCNRPGQPVFYCSENRPTSFMELAEEWAESHEVGDTLKVTIGLWELKKSLNAIVVTTPDSSQRISEYDKEHGKAFDLELQKLSGEELESQKLFYRFLFEKFREPAKNDLKTYIITSAYCNLALMRANGIADAVYFPSVPFQGNGNNLAISANHFSLDNLELKAAMRNDISISADEGGKPIFKEISKDNTDKINVEDNSINWDN